MKKIVLIGILGLLLSSAVAVPGLNLHYVGGMHAFSDYQIAALHPSTGDLRWYRLYPAGNGFAIHSYYMTTNCAASLQQDIYAYEHPVDFLQDGGFPELVLSQAYAGKVYFLQKNDLHLFMTVIDENLQVSTVVTNNPGLSFEADPLFRRTFCFLSPQLMILSSAGSIYLLNLQTALCTYYWTFPNAEGMIRFSRLDETYVTFAASTGWPTATCFLLNYQTLTRTQIYSTCEWETFPISADFGNDTFLVTQSYALDWTMLVYTKLMHISDSGSAMLYLLYYGGYDGSGGYTPRHSFGYVNLLGDNRFLAICTDLYQIPENQRLGLFQIVGNSVVYDPLFPGLHALDDPSRIYPIQDNYYLSYHNNATAAERVRLLDLEAEAISVADTNLILSPSNIIPTGNNAFYAVLASQTVLVYTLVEPSAAPDETQVPPTQLGLNLCPNPFRDKLAISLSGRAGAATELKIYDLRGRLVRSMEGNNGAESGWEWDGRDGGGKRLPAGIYLIRARSGGATAFKRSVLLD